MRIEDVEIDDGNVDHVTRDGASLADIEVAVMGRPSGCRNRGRRAGEDYAVANGIRVNFLYRPGIARPISAWRL